MDSKPEPAPDSQESIRAGKWNPQQTAPQRDHYRANSAWPCSGNQCIQLVPKPQGLCQEKTTGDSLYSTPCAFQGLKQTLVPITAKFLFLSWQWRCNKSSPELLLLIDYGRALQMVRKRDASAVDTNAESLQAAKQLRSAPGPTQSDCGGIGDSDAGGSSHSRVQRELDQWKGNNIYQPGAPTDMLLQLKNSNSTQPDLLAFARGTSSFEPHKLKQGE